MNSWTGADWDDDVVLVEEPVYYDWECPDGYVRDDWGRCVPEVREVFVIEREILYLYPDLVATYPDLQLHPEFLFRYRPELRTRYANVRSVSELRNRYTSYHHTAPPQRPASAPPVSHAAKAPGAPPSKRGPAQPPVHAQPSPSQPGTQPPAHAQPSRPSAQPGAPGPMKPPPTAHGAPMAPTPPGPGQPSTQHGALAQPSPPIPHTQQPGISGPTGSKDKTATSGLFTETNTRYLMGGALAGALYGLFVAGDDEETLKFPIAFAAMGAIVGAVAGVGIEKFQQRRASPRVGYYVPGLFPETREWLEGEF